MGRRLPTVSGFFSCFNFGEVPVRLIFKTKGEASAYSDRKTFLQAEAEALRNAEGTDEIPLLADEPPVDGLLPLKIDEVAVEDEGDPEFPPAPLEVVAEKVAEDPAVPKVKVKAPARTETAPAVKKKKKVKSETWDL